MKFALIYIMEAHATDEWPILDTDTSFTQHKTIEDRRRAAEFTCKSYPLLQTKEGLGTEIYLDNMQNGFNSAYASWPLRYWVLMAGKLEFKAMPTGARFPLDELDNAIHSALNKVQAVTTTEGLSVFGDRKVSIE